ncbi:MAG: adenosine kinase [Pseudobdellovibrionaceae bacterium]
MTSRYGVTAIGNAIVDILAPASDELVNSQAAFGMHRGAMNLIDAPRAAEIYAMMGAATEVSGGSAANTMAGFASFGGKGAFIGKVADDQMGRIFRHDMQAGGVTFRTPPAQNHLPTAQCLILVTPDSQRTMNTFLGISTKLAPADVDEDLISSSRVTYLEGYLFDEIDAKAAYRKASELVKKHDRRIALTLSDTFCVQRHHADFLNLVDHHVDILFANEAELLELTGLKEIDYAVSAIRDKCPISVVTRGKNGSYIVTKDTTYKIDAIPPQQLIDTTGAGDAYAAGFLFGLTEGLPLPECGRLGSLAASEVISHLGPRPMVSLKTLV